MLKTNEEILLDAKTKIDAAKDAEELSYSVKPAFFGKGGAVSSIMAGLKTASADEKKEIGIRCNALKSSIEAMIDAKMQSFDGGGSSGGKFVNFDISLPVQKKPMGSVHPISFVANEITAIFAQYGFSLNTGPEIETDYYNFTALNMHENHPARQMQDTFYMLDNVGNNDDSESNKYVLRTHTTAVDIRELKKHGAPMRSISFGKTFRNDSDKTHSPMFHQMEILSVEEKGGSMAQLRSLLLKFLREFFETDDIEIRLRPSFFPFTEPSAEIDIKYSVVDGNIVLSKTGDKWLEILGCGMLHPKVLENCGVDSEKYTAIAAGMGVERLAMLKYGISDLREFFACDLDWLRKNSFSVTAMATI